MQGLVSLRFETVICGKVGPRPSECFSERCVCSAAVSAYFTCFIARLQMPFYSITPRLFLSKNIIRTCHLDFRRRKRKHFCASFIFVRFCTLYTYIFIRACAFYIYQWAFTQQRGCLSQIRNTRTYGNIAVSSLSMDLTPSVAQLVKQKVH